MKYYILTNPKQFGEQQTWQECQFDPSKRQIKLYNDKFEFIGVGLY